MLAGVFAVRAHHQRHDPVHAVAIARLLARYEVGSVRV